MVTAASRIVNPDSNSMDVVVAKTLRPDSWEGFIGQGDVVKQVLIAQESAAKRREAVDHMIFIGPPGLGKTTLARLIGGRDMVELNMSGTSKETIGRHLLDIMPAGTVFLEEAHALERGVTEILCTAMEDFKVPDPYSGTLAPANQFSVVAATTNFSKLPAPLRNRFTYIFRLHPYTEREIGQIVATSGVKLEVSLASQAVPMIASRARGTPRLANRYLKILRNYSDDISTEVANRAFKDLGIDDKGLDEIDRKYLGILQQSRVPMGLTTLAGYMSMPEEDISEMIEPYLLQMRLVMKTPKGRVLVARS